ncbi:hypothetical protein E5K00_18900 [Hymenobacter aquaticus]|uniref:Iminophenyl-pyruvate dimer synthase domain-containing protein n=1 Tax=Hymenobacter aquaticus TaxID=1867101 RepID=A0A4Z0PYB7_9BACT|nr:ferritin-like protein [Hymenobacter aquaticus]TGE22314.1 hypothetical protein E5K00_18900 [Hymenobacter aquaticus]
MLLLKSSLAQDLTDPAALRTALQQAIELEHSTIPPYLYALYSLIQGKNDAIAALIQSVVIEEMTHMALACNILNAIGGAPVIDSPDFIPQYPGPLPGTVESQLTVPLAPFSLDLVKNVFMVIEEPEDPLNYPVVGLRAAAAPPLTIGQFYEKIREALIANGEGIFTGDTSRQVSATYMGITPVTNLAQAVAAIDLIVEQGEGTTTSPQASPTELAHYYRFAEIYHGRQLVPTTAAVPVGAEDAEPFDDGYSYSGPAIAFDPAGVYPVVTNPKAAQYAPGTLARNDCDTFNYSYTGLLQALHQTFNGTPAAIQGAIGAMFTLKTQAIGMMQVVIKPGSPTTAGPSFEYQPTLPADQSA